MEATVSNVLLGSQGTYTCSTVEFWSRTTTYYLHIYLDVHGTIKGETVT